MDLETHYATGPAEHTRLARTPHGRLEYLRTRELLRRFLPETARILDVGGGTGIHAEWLAAEGHAVHLVDLVPDHVAHPRSTPPDSAGRFDTLAEAALRAARIAEQDPRLVDVSAHLLAVAHRPR